MVISLSCNKKKCISPTCIITNSYKPMHCSTEEAMPWPISIKLGTHNLFGEVSISIEPYILDNELKVFSSPELQAK